MSESETPHPAEPEEGPERKLPNMNEFSPGVLLDNNVRRLLALLQPLEGDKAAMISHIATTYEKIRATDAAQRNNRANNVLIGMSQCGLLEKDGSDIAPRLSDLAKNILAQPDDARANALFGRHLLEHCHGLELIDVVSMIRARGEAVTLNAIRIELRARGFVVTENEGNSSKIRQWLESTKAIDDEWNIDEPRLQALIGAHSGVLAKWNGLTRAQRIFLEHIRHQAPVHGGDWMPVRKIKKICEAAYSRSVFPEGRLRDDVIAPLVGDGWIEARGTGAGRGGDSGDVKPLPQLLELKVKLPVEGASGIPADLRDKLSKPLDDIFTDLESTNTGIKGLALELLALRFTREIGLFPVGFRERSAKTGGAEVDLIANGINLHYSRWLVQCKNTTRVRVDDIAKEVGMALVLKAHVVLMVTTGHFSRAVRTFADNLAATTQLQAVLIDKPLLDKYRQGGGQAIIDWMKTAAYRVLTLKEPQVTEVEDE